MTAFVHADECQCAPCVDSRASRTLVADFEARARAILERLVVDPQDEPTFECPTCFDKAYTLLEEPHGRSVYRRLCVVSRPCTSCGAGIAIEAGEWARLLRPRKGKQPPGRKLLNEYSTRLRNHPHGLRLRECVDAQLSKPVETEAPA